MSQPTLTLKRNRAGEPTRLLFSCDRRDNLLVKDITCGVARWSSGAWSMPVDPTLARGIASCFTDLTVTEETSHFFSQLREHQQYVLESTQDESPFAGKDDLWGFQRASVRFLLCSRKTILAHDMGTGKTVIASYAANKAQADRMLVVCPNSVKGSWAEHLRDWADWEDNVYELESSGSTKLKQIKDPDTGATICKGATDARQDFLAATMTQQDRFVIILNYEQMTIHRGVLSHNPKDIIIFDEAHRLKNRKSLRSQVAREVSTGAEYVWLLTGTPVQNDYSDLWMLLNLCDPNRFSGYWNFVNTYFRTVELQWGGSDIVGLRDEQSFAKMLTTYMFRKTKEEAMPHLPPKLYNDYRIYMKPEQQEAYLQMEKDFMLSIQKELENGEKIDTLLMADQVIAQITRLRQICLTPAILGGAPSSGKLDALADILSDFKHSGESFIIFTCYRSFLPFVEDILERLRIPYGMIVGGQSGQERARVERSLNTGRIQGILGTIQSMGEGMNLQKATTEIFCDITWVPATNRQAEDRIHRGEIKVSPNIIRLYHPNTIEVDIRAVCKHKEDIEDRTVGRVETVRQMLLRRGV